MVLILGVGYNDRRYPARMSDKNRPVREYDLWRSMLYRCYSKEKQKTSPTYIGCTVHEFFHSYSNFYEWCQNQIGFSKTDRINLDKDLVGCGKIYSPDICVFLPPMVNGVLTTTKASRGECPIGVHWYKKTGRYKAQIEMFNKKYALGYFDDPTEAFNVYKTAREEHIKNVANIYKDQIDPRAYQALMDYTVNIDD